MRFRLLYLGLIFPKDIIPHILSFVNNFCREFTNIEICRRLAKDFVVERKKKNILTFFHFPVEYQSYMCYN